VLSLGVAVLLVRWRAWRGRGRAAGQEPSAALDKGFIVALDIQVGMGLLLYLVLSPLPRLALQDIGAAMSDGVTRFYSVEHAFGMSVALIAAHVGYARLRSSSPPGEHYGSALLGQAVWLFVTLGSIPWPGLPYGRPLLRLFF